MNTHTPPAPLAHSVIDAGARLGVGRTTIFQLIAEGQLRTFKIGARTLVPEDELRRLIETKMGVAA